MDVQATGPYGTSMVDWSQPAVQVAFDEWAALQEPAMNTGRRGPSGGA